MEDDMYVVSTLFDGPTQIFHVYGPYPTRAKAKVVEKKMIDTVREEMGIEVRNKLVTWVSKVIDTTKMDEENAKAEWEMKND